MLIVTGATGLLGNTVVRRAIARQIEVTALVRPKSAAEGLVDLAVKRVPVDFLKDDLTRLIGAGDVVVHAAARVAIGQRHPDAARRANLAVTQRIAEACRIKGARLLYVSTVDTRKWGTRTAPGDESPAIDLTAPSVYAKSKREAEGAVAVQVEKGLDAVTVYPGFLIGPNDWKPSSGQLLLSVARAPVMFAPPGGNDFCHVGDVADGILEAAFKAPAGSGYVLGGEALSYYEAFRMMRAIAGQKGPLLKAPVALIKMAGYAGDIAGLLTGREPTVNGVSAAISCLPHHFSSDKARRELGYTTRPAQMAIDEAWAWFKQHGYA